MTATNRTSPIPKLFYYRDLYSEVEKIQNELIEMRNILDSQCQTIPTIQNELKSRELTFIDAYGNLTFTRYMDHEPINKILQKYKENSVPKHLQEWMKVGTLDDKIVSYSIKSQPNLLVSDFANDHPFFTYGELTVWIGSYEDTLPRKIRIQVRMTDNMEKVKMLIKQHRRFANVELKSCIIDENVKPNIKDWTNSTTLKSEDTIISSQLYQNNCVILAKPINKDGTSLKIIHCQLYVETLAKVTYTFDVNSVTDIATVKELVQTNSGIPSGQQGLIFRKREIKDGGTLSDYYVPEGETLILIVRGRSEFYNDSEDWIGFQGSFGKCDEAVSDVFRFNFKNRSDIQNWPPVELQNSILLTQTKLTTLYRGFANVSESSDIPHLKTIILPTPVGNDKSADEE